MNSGETSRRNIHLFSVNFAHAALNAVTNSRGGGFKSQRDSSAFSSELMPVVVLDK